MSDDGASRRTGTFRIRDAEYQLLVEQAERLRRSITRQVEQYIVDGLKRDGLLT